MRSVIFIETKENGVLFKCDTFWSKSERPRNAKVYSDIPTESQIIPGILPHNVYKDMMEKVKSRYDGSRLGYFTPDESLLENQYCLKDGVKVEDLGKPKYLWSIKMNEISDWVITKEYKAEKEGDKDSADIDTKSMGDFFEYKQQHRNDIISEVLKEKESD